MNPNATEDTKRSPLDRRHSRVKNHRQIMLREVWERIPNQDRVVHYRGEELYLLGAKQHGPEHVVVSKHYKLRRKEQN